MVSNAAMNKISGSISTMTKSEIKKHLLNFQGRFNMDFTDTYLDNLSEEKLRHILFAAIAIHQM